MFSGVKAFFKFAEGFHALREKKPHNADLTGPHSPCVAHFACV